jgi:hypothetical protein
VAPPVVTDALRDRRFVVLGADRAAESWFESHQLKTSRDLDGLQPQRDMVIIWSAENLKAEHKRRADVLRTFISNGGRVVVLGTRHWDWRDLCDVKTGDPRGSRAFLYEGASHQMLAGIRPEWLIRWNGLPGTVAVGNLDGPALETGRRVLWVREPATCVVAELPVTRGEGTILFSQLDVQRHVNRPEPIYDPVAERILVNILGQMN